MSTHKQGKTISGSPILSEIYFGDLYDCKHSAVVDSGSDANVLDYNIFKNINKNNLKSLSQNSSVSLMSAAGHKIKIALM